MPFSDRRLSLTHPGNVPAKLKCRNVQLVCNLSERATCGYVYVSHACMWVHDCGVHGKFPVTLAGCNWPRVSNSFPGHKRPGTRDERLFVIPNGVRGTDIFPVVFGAQITGLTALKNNPGENTSVFQNKKINKSNTVLIKLKSKEPDVYKTVLFRSKQIRISKTMRSSSAVEKRLVSHNRTN